MQVEHGLRLRAGPDNRFPIRIEYRGKALAVGLFGNRDRFESPCRIATNLFGTHRRIRHVRDPQRHNAVGIRGVPLFEEPIVPGPGAGDSQFPVVDQAEKRASKAGDSRRKIHRGVDPPDIHVLDSIVDPVTTGTYLIKASGLHPVVLFGPTRHAHKTHLKIRLAIHHPHLVPLLGLHDLGAPLLQSRRKPTLEGFRRLHQVIVH